MWLPFTVRRFEAAGPVTLWMAEAAVKLRIAALEGLIAHKGITDDGCRRPTSNRTALNTASAIKGTPTTQHQPSSLPPASWTGKSGKGGKGGREKGGWGKSSGWEAGGKGAGGWGKSGGWEAGGKGKGGGWKGWGKGGWDQSGWNQSCNDKGKGEGKDTDTVRSLLHLLLGELTVLQSLFQLVLGGAAVKDFEA